MIKNITGGGKYMMVTYGAASTYVNNYNGAQGVGNMRFNTSTQNVEIYDGNGWVPMQSGYANISMTSEAESLLDWARQKRAEEMELNELAKTNPTIADLQKQIKEKKEQIDIVRALTAIEVKIG